MKKLKLKKIKTILQKTPRVLAERGFLTFFVFLFVFLIFGALIFYNYSILAEKKEIENLAKPGGFKAETYQIILKIWQERQKNFDEAATKKYPNPFLVSTSTEELSR